MLSLPDIPAAWARSSLRDQRQFLLSHNRDRPGSNILPSVTPVPPTASQSLLPRRSCRPKQAALTPEPQATDGTLVSGGGATLVFQAGAALNLLDARAANISQLSGNAQPEGPASISPDGTRILFDRLVDGRRRSIFMIVLQARPINLFQATTRPSIPSWSPDGSKVVFAAKRDGNSDIFELDIASGRIVRLTDIRAKTITIVQPWRERGRLGTTARRRMADLPHESRWRAPDRRADYRRRRPLSTRLSRRQTVGLRIKSRPQRRQHGSVRHGHRQWRARTPDKRAQRLGPGTAVVAG